jgi:hypothetical protein
LFQQFAKVGVLAEEFLNGEHGVGGSAGTNGW